MTSLNDRGTSIALRAVGTFRAAEITHQPRTEILRALQAVDPYHELWGKRVGQRFAIRVDELLRWLIESPDPRDRELADELMKEPKLEARVFDLKTAARAYSVSTSRLKREIEANRLLAKRLETTSAAKYLVSVKDLDHWFESLPDA